MTKERKYEIGYLLLVQQLQQQGLVLNTAFKSQLDNASRTLDVFDGEMKDFAVLITQDVAETAAIPTS